MIGHVLSSLCKLFNVRFLFVFLQHFFVDLIPQEVDSIISLEHLFPDIYLCGHLFIICNVQY